MSRLLYPLGNHRLIPIKYVGRVVPRAGLEALEKR